MDSIEIKIQKLESILNMVWSKESSSKWTLDNPAQGQCGVTSLVVNDLLGGEILKTYTLGGWHFYNRVFGQRLDFTKSQFFESISYDDLMTSREEAFLDTNIQQYSYLKKSVFHYWDI